MSQEHHPTAKENKIAESFMDPDREAADAERKKDYHFKKIASETGKALDQGSQQAMKDLTILGGPTVNAIDAVGNSTKETLEGGIDALSDGILGLVGLGDNKK